jgi:hypothetical protein
MTSEEFFHHLYEKVNNCRHDLIVEKGPHYEPTITIYLGHNQLGLLYRATSSSYVIQEELRQKEFAGGAIIEVCLPNHLFVTGF